MERFFEVKHKREEGALKNLKEDAKKNLKLINIQIHFIYITKTRTIQKKIRTNGNGVLRRVL